MWLLVFWVKESCYNLLAGAEDNLLTADTRLTIGSQFVISYKYYCGSSSPSPVYKYIRCYPGNANKD